MGSSAARIARSSAARAINGTGRARRPWRRPVPRPACLGLVHLVFSSRGWRETESTCTGINMQMLHRGSYCGYLCRALVESVTVIFFWGRLSKGFPRPRQPAGKFEVRTRQMQNMILGCECAASRCTRSHKLQTRKQESINHERLPTLHARNSSKKRPAASR